MGLKYGDLKGTVIKHISFDQYEPKTGESKDTIVMAFQTPEKAVGDDLYSFLNNGNKKIKDVDVSPNKNDDGYYMVFIEFERNDKTIDMINEIISDIENLTGKLSWDGVTHIHDEPFKIDKNLSEYIMTDPDSYMDKEEWEKTQSQEENQAQEIINNSILEFLSSSSLSDVEISENTISMKYYDTSADLEIVGFGEAKEVMNNIGIAESALKENDSVMRKFNTMLGEMRAVRIDEYVVIFHPNQTQALVAKENVYNS